MIDLFLSFGGRGMVRIWEELGEVDKYDQSTLCKITKK